MGLGLKILGSGFRVQALELGSGSLGQRGAAFLFSSPPRRVMPFQCLILHVENHSYAPSGARPPPKPGSFERFFFRASKHFEKFRVQDVRL